MIDLHIHTNYSDGTDNCLTILNKIKKQGITVFSITDHDIIDGNLEMLAILERSNNINNPQFITGIEMSAIYNGIELHLLGYGFDIQNEEVTKMIKVAKENRRKKMQYRIEYLKRDFNIEFTKEEKEWLGQLSTACKPHLMKLIKLHGFGYNEEDLLSKYFDKYTTSEFKICAEHIIKCIHTASGIVSISHPKEIMRKLNFDFVEIDFLCSELKKIGLDAIEAYHSSHTSCETNGFLKIAQRHNLYVSGGSDYHGELKNGISLGKLTAVGKDVIHDSSITILRYIRAFN